jgi:hypothetical protein
MRNFETWDTEAVETELGLVQVRQSNLLNDWLSSTTTFDESERKILAYLKDKLFDNAEFWNEDELKLQFIGPLLLIVGYDMPIYKVFSQRSLSATINDIEIGGRVDFMIAKGKQRPSKPYFFIHEYKQETKGSADPKGQLLSELAAAQYRNEHKFPVYGCYVIGRNWFFVVLDNNEYAVSKPYIASDEEIYKIVAMLREIKVYLAKIVVDFA